MKLVLKLFGQYKQSLKIAPNLGSELSRKDKSNVEKFVATFNKQDDVEYCRCVMEEGDLE